MIENNGRGGGIRTPDPLVPNQMRYQTALRPDFFQFTSSNWHAGSQRAEETVTTSTEE
jgi:hypothetical protein